MVWALLPGGGHFAMGETGTGIAYAASTAVFLLGGAALQDRNEELGRDEDEVNTPSIVGEKIWEMSLFTTWRSSLQRRYGMDARSLGIDDTSATDLWLARFKWDNFSDPFVLAALGAGIAGALIGTTDIDGRGRFDDVDEVGILGQTVNRDRGSALYTLAAGGISLGAGVAEEAIFRGILQTEFERAWGPSRGLWAASAIFGAAHLVGVDGDFQPEAVAFTTLGGAYFGWMYQRNGHRLSRPIAAHFWYDFALFMTAYFRDPDDTPLGIKVGFEF